MSIQRGLPALFSFGNSSAAHAPELTDDERLPAHTGEAAAIRVLYQAPPRRPKRPSRGKPVREWLASVLDALMPRPAPAYVRVPAYARARR